MADDREELSAAERDAIRAWGESWEPPAELRERTRSALHDRGLLGVRSGGLRRRATLWTAAAAAVAVAFLSGFGVGRQSSTTATVSSPEPSPAPTGALYMLLLYESDAYHAPTSPEEHRARVGEYGGWAREIAGSGRYVDGNELASEGRWCRPAPDGIEVLAPMLDPVRGRLAGYFVIGASSDDDAFEITKGCPHLRHGGTVEIRRVGSS